MDFIELFWRVYKGNRVRSRRSSEYVIYTRHVSQANIDWGQIDNLPKAVLICYYNNPYLIEDLSKMKICFNCFKLHGQVRIGGSGVKRQECLCTTNKIENKWDGYDFNIKYETCHCCGLEVIPSGSRWSVLYCKDCKNRIMELNAKVRQCVIPIGRHSLMNRIYLNGQMPVSAIGQFVSAVNKMNNLLELVIQHHKDFLTKQLRILNLTKDAPVIKLILQTNDQELKQIKIGAFFELLAACTNMPVDEVKLSYKELMS